MERADVVIIGGGIAGLSAAYHLAPSARVVLCEREPHLGFHSTGRNAAIFRHVDPGPAALELAVRSRALLDGLFDGRRGDWLDVTGAWYVAPEPAPVRELHGVAARSGVTAALHLEGGWAASAPLLEGGDTRAALHVPEDGAVDVHAVVTALARVARRRGAVIRTGAGVRALEVERGVVRGVHLDGGERLPATHVVLAAGAWAGELGAAAGAPLPLEPRRRHLALLETEPAPRPHGPVIWRIADPVYLRPESGGLLASPCDEKVWPPGIPPVDDEALVSLGEKLAEVTPRIGDARVRRVWSGLRTFAPDAGFVVGPDPRLRGLHWVAGLGGHGVTGGLAAAEILAALLAGREHPLARATAPARLL